MQSTTIEWCTFTTNPLRAVLFAVAGAIGHYCEKISAACKNCYASAFQPRFHMPTFGANSLSKTPFYNLRVSNDRAFDVPAPLPNGLGLVLDWNKLSAVMNRRKAERIFWCDMTDLFGWWVPRNWIDACLAVMALTPHHTHLLLTKRDKAMMEYMNDPDTPRRVAALVRKSLHPNAVVVATYLERGLALEEGVEPTPGWPLRNLHLGVTAETQADADARLPFLVRTKAAVRYVSMEPLLERVNIGRYTGRPGLPTDDPAGRCANCGIEGKDCGEMWVGDGCCDGEWACSQRCDEQLTALGCPLEHPPIDGVIGGGESGIHARPTHLLAARDLRDQCVATDTRFFWKQWGAYLPVEARQDGDRVVMNPGVSLGTFKHLLRWDDDGVARLAAPEEPADTFLRPGYFADKRGKKASGRSLDGVTWDQLPQPRAAV